MPEEKVSFPASLNGIPGVLYFEGLILRHEDPNNPESYRQSISLLHVSRIAYGVRYRPIWPLIIGVILLVAGVALIGQNQPVYTDAGVVLSVLALLIGASYFFRTDSISVVVETHSGKHEISIYGDVKFLREFYLRLETAWMLAQARLAGNRKSGEGESQ